MHLGIDAHLLLRARMTGVERYAKCLLERMALTTPRDWRVTLYGNGERPAWMMLPASWTWKRLAWPFGRGWTHGRLSLEMLTMPPDVLFVPGHEVPLFVRAKTQVVTTLHDVAFKRFPETYPAAAVRRQDMAVLRAIARANRILTPSQATKRDLIELYGVSGERVVVTHLAPTMPLAHAIDALVALRLRPNMYFLFIGRLEAKKGVVDAVRAFTTLKASLGHGDPYMLALVGDFGFGGDDVKRAIEASGIAHDIRVFGYVNDDNAAALLANALALIMPSRAEGFGIPVVEAMAAGCPVIASDAPALVEVCQGACAESRVGDVSSLAQAMWRMVSDAPERERLIAQGRERAKAFDWGVTARRTWDVVVGL